MLNPRLEACAKFIKNGALVCDVGTDHALLAVHLITQGIAESVIASDIGEGPLQAAQRTIQKYGLSEQISTILSDGLVNVPSEGLTDIVIAGMGGETMVHILETCPFSLENINLVLQPMSKADLLRKWLYENGFAIEKETCIKDGKFLYAVMTVLYTGVRETPDPACIRLGKMDLTNPDCLAYAQRQYDVVCMSRDGRKQAGMDASEFEETAEAIRLAMEGVRK